jgi:hypothetical protein
VSLAIDENVQASSAHDQHGDPLILTDPDGQFARNYNRQPFAFPHGLKDHPLLELPNLIELAKRPFHHEPYWSTAQIKVNDSWGTGEFTGLSLTDTIANIGETNSIVLLKHVEQDPVYGPVLQDLLARVIELSGEQMRQEAVIGEGQILIASPNRITPYHMDLECNFLFQSVGSKTLYVYDHTDRTLVPHEAREQYYKGNQNSIAYEERRQCEATAYELAAGDGVHIPVFAPHWARNHDNISVAVSINYELISTLGQKRIYQINGLLRKLGIAPAAPGESPWRDRVKHAAACSLIAARNLIKSRPASAYPVWTPPST